MSEHPGLLGFISEAAEIREHLGISVDESFRIQRENAAERLRSSEEPAAEKSNVIQFRPKGS